MAARVQQEVVGPNELAAVARARGVELKLEPFATVFQRGRFHWFDAVLMMIAILPPVAWWWRRRGAVAVLLMATAACSEGTVVSGRRNGVGNFDPATDRFVWYSGEVTMPARFWRHVLIPTDTFEGVLVGTSDRKLDLYHDIGGVYAGAYANPKEALRFEERSRDGARIWLAHRWSGPPNNRQFKMAVTFPDSGCANFFLYTKDSRDWDVVDFIARSYRPRGTIESACGQ